MCDDYPEDEDRCEELQHRHSSWQVRTEVPHDPTWISYQVVETNCESDARWLALLSPAVAEPLAAWLERAAARGDLVKQETEMITSVPPEALALARVLLGEAS